MTRAADQEVNIPPISTDFWVAIWVRNDPTDAVVD